MDQPTETTGSEQVEDTGDLIDPTVYDPPPEEITDPADPSYVEPAPDAVRFNPELLTDIDSGFLAPGEVGGPVARSPEPADADPERDPEGCA